MNRATLPLLHTTYYSLVLPSLPPREEGRGWLGNFWTQFKSFPFGFSFLWGGGIETIVSCTSSYSLPGINIRARTVLAHTTLEYAYITSIAVFKRTWMTYYAQLCFLIAAGVVGGCRGVGRGRRVPSSAGAPGPSQLPNPQPPQARDTVTCSRKLGGAHIRAVAERSATFRF